MRKILLVDDNPLILTVLSEAFSNDYLVVTAGSGEEAMAILEDSAPASSNFDLIITDLNMHEMSGYELAKYVKTRNRHNKFTPVIMLTSADITKEEARQYGCAAYVPKADLQKVVSITHILLPR
jgi:CheY-like chemotaxis protein